MTDAHSSGELAGRSEISSVTNAHCDINRVVGLDLLASTMQLLLASLVPETYEEYIREHVSLKKA